MVGITAVSRGFGAILAMSLPASAALSAQLRSAETVLQRALLVEAVEHTDARRSQRVLLFVEPLRSFGDRTSLQRSRRLRHEDRYRVLPAAVFNDAIATGRWDGNGCARAIRCAHRYRCSARRRYHSSGRLRPEEWYGFKHNAAARRRLGRRRGAAAAVWRRRLRCHHERRR